MASSPLSTAYTRSRREVPLPGYSGIKATWSVAPRDEYFFPFWLLFRFMSCSAFGAYVSAIPSALPLQCDKVRSVVLKDILCRETHRSSACLEIPLICVRMTNWLLHDAASHGHAPTWLPHAPDSKHATHHLGSSPTSDSSCYTCSLYRGGLFHAPRKNSHWSYPRFC